MMQPSQIRGAYTALVTPFAAGQVDEDAFSALVDWQIVEGIHGLVPVGTTGESRMSISVWWSCVSLLQKDACQ